MEKSKTLLREMLSYISYRSASHGYAVQSYDAHHPETYFAQ